MDKLGPQVLLYPSMDVSGTCYCFFFLTCRKHHLMSTFCLFMKLYFTDILTNAHVFTSFLDNISNRTWPNLRSGISLRVRIDSPQQQVNTWGGTALFHIYVLLADISFSFIMLIAMGGRLRGSLCLRVLLGRCIDQDPRNLCSEGIPAVFATPDQR